MAYDVTLVELESSSTGVGMSGAPSGFASSFSYLLASMWVCAPYTGGTRAAIRPFADFATIYATADTVQVELNLGSLYNATFGNFTGSLGQRYNVLVSVDCVHQVMQVYVNDSPATIVLGSGWRTTGNMVHTGTLFEVLGFPFVNYPAFADLWWEAPVSFVDLSVVANRRKFIDNHLSPVDLGSAGQNPFGSSPPIFLTVPSMGVPTDIQTNFGTGGPLSTLNPAVTLAFQPANTCTVAYRGFRPMSSIIGKTLP